MLKVRVQRALVRAILLFSFLAATMSVTAQTVVYKWSSNDKEPESYPRITKRETVTFNITEVNDILYKYRLEVTETPISYDDFNAIASILRGFAKTGAPAAKAGQCVTEGNFSDTLMENRDRLVADPLLPLGYDKLAKKTSVSLKASQDAWSIHRKAADKLAGDLSRLCQPPLSASLDNQYQKYVKAVDDIQLKVDSSHVFSATSIIGPGSKVSAIVFESFKDEQISSKTFTFSTVDVLTLSAGALFSNIPDRSYEARKSPNSTLNILSVDGNSRATPSLVALLNYHLWSMKNEFLGVALSAGPVIRLGSNSDASSFGFFTGVSTNLYNRFFITPGFHFGQFSDFPVGFANGSTVPENFGELTPVKRWTARFGLAITFKTKDFSGLTSSSKPTVTGSEGDDGGDKKKKEDKDKEDDSNSVNRSSSSMNVARDFLRQPSERRETAPTSGAFVETSARTEVAQVPETRPDMKNLYSTPSRDAYFVSTPASASSPIHVRSLHSFSDSSMTERIMIEASAAISFYVMYFKGGRFFLVLPQSKIDGLEDELTGQTFSDVVVEKRAGDLILSFALSPGIKASVLERPSGLEIFLLRAGTN
jgi:hypothetical protein